MKINFFLKAVQILSFGAAFLVMFGIFEAPEIFETKYLHKVSVLIFVLASIGMLAVKVEEKLMKKAKNCS